MDVNKLTTENDIDEFINIVLNGYEFTELNEEALKFMLEDAKKDYLKVKGGIENE